MSDETLIEVPNPILGFEPPLIDSVFEMLAFGQSNVLDESADRQPWILCIDDDAMFSMFLSRRFEQIGWNVVRACEGIAGLEKAQLNPPSAIVLDYHMPIVSGDAVLGRLRRNKKTSAIPVFIVSADEDIELRDRMFRLGANGYFLKPVDINALACAIQDTFRQ